MAYQNRPLSDDQLAKKLNDELFSSSIAIIDDLESNRSFLEHLAQRLPEVRHVSSYSSAIEALKAFDETDPDVVITDFNMPGMNADEFLQEFRKKPDFQDIPVIVISSQNETDNRHRALIAGATDFLMVPFDTFEFQARARNLLRLSLHQKNLKSQSRSLESELLETRYRSLETQHRFTSIIDSVPALVFAVDAAGQCVFANNYCFEFLGLPSDASPNDIRFLADKVSAIDTSSADALHTKSYEIELTGGDGRDHVFLVAPKSIEKDDTGNKLIVYSGIEITRLKHTEYSLRRAKEAAEAANRAKSAFLSNMTHEIRTPLNAIMGFADVMCNELHGPVENKKYKSYLYDIQSSAKHLLSVVNEILDFSQIEAQRFSANISTFSLKSCLKEIQNIMEHQLDARENKLRFVSIPNIELISDRQKLSQVLLNILANANKAVRDGTICVSAQASRTSGLFLTIKDGGIGMNERELALAVTEFGRAMTSAFVSDGHSGTGLGLPISIRLMKLLGGDLHIESQKGIGTEVCILLPAASIARSRRKKVTRPRAAMRNGPRSHRVGNL